VAGAGTNKLLGEARMLIDLFAKIDDGDWQHVGVYETAIDIRIAKLNFDYCNAQHPIPKITYREEPVDKEQQMLYS
jgi:hypothetical protein